MNERHWKLKKKSNVEAAENSEERPSKERPGPSGQNDSSPRSSFSTKQSLHRSLSRVNNLLPKSPYKKAEVIEILAE